MSETTTWHHTPDGRRARLRAARPEDRAAYAAAVAGLSAETRYRRFMTPMPRLHERDLNRLMDLDPGYQVVVFAFDDAADDAGDEFNALRAEAVGIGVARIVWTGPGRGEVAFTVSDPWQGQGLGGALLDRLLELARDFDATLLTAETLADNRVAIGLLRSRGFLETGWSGTTRSWELRVGGG